MDWTQLHIASNFGALTNRSSGAAISTDAPLEVWKPLGACGGKPCQRHVVYTGAVEKLLDPCLERPIQAYPAGVRQERDFQAETELTNTDPPARQSPSMMSRVVDLSLASPASRHWTTCVC